MNIIALVLAVTSPLATAADYHFTRPAHPAAIHGIVSGDQSTAGVPRMEDQMFLDEAVAERIMALYQGGTSSWMTAVGRFLTQTNILTRLSRLRTELVSSYAPPSRTLLDSPIVITNLTDYVTTNFYFGVDLGAVDEWYSITNTISQTMTNGTTDVFREVIPDDGTLIASNQWIMAVGTTAFPISYYCYAGRPLTWQEAYPSNIIVNGGYAGIGFDPWMSRSAANDAFEYVRALRVSAPIASSALASSNNIERSSRTDGGPISTHASDGDPIYYSHSELASRTAIVSQHRSDGEWVTDSDSDTVYTTSSRNRSTTPFRIRLPISGLADMFASDSGRIARAFGFVMLSITRELTRSSDYTTETGERVSVNLPTESVSKDVMIPLGEIYWTLSLSEFLEYDVEKEPLSVISEAVAAASIELPEFGSAPALQELPTASYHETGEYRGKEASCSARLSVTVILKGTFVIVEIRPNTVLPDWSEYAD